MVQVLVVDDDPSTREVLREVLEQAGYEVREASDDDAALDMLRRGPSPVVALLDLDMPGTNGLDVLRASAEESHALGRHRYILMTAVAQARVQQAAGILSPLSVPVVNKPFDVDDLLSLVEQCAASLPVTPYSPVPPDVGKNLDRRPKVRATLRVRDATPPCQADARHGGEP